MSLNTAAIEVLVAKGLSAQDILELSRALDVKSDPTAAERKRRQRQKEADEREEISQRDVTRDAPFPAPPNENNLTPPTHTPENITPARKGDRTKPHIPAKPDDVSGQTWADFVQHRKVKRAPVSETAMAGIRREAKIAGWSLEAALAETVSRGWQSFKAEFVAPKANGPGGSAPGSFLAHLSGASP